MKRLLTHSQLALLALLPFAHAQEKDLAKLPEYQTPVPYAGSRDYHLTQNLGATGARGWIEGNKGHSHDSREILIKSVEPGSPAAGILQPYDLIIGAAVPPDTLMARWRARTLQARPNLHAGLLLSPLSLLIWILLIAALATRSTRWRLG